MDSLVCGNSSDAGLVGSDTNALMVKMMVWNVDEDL